MQLPFYRRFGFAIAATAVVQLTLGCANPPPAEQYLDTHTGATIFRVHKPLPLVRSRENQSEAETEYVTIAPFEVNRMGDYRLYLWVAFSSLEHTSDDASDSLERIDITLDDQVYNLVMVTTEGRTLGIGEPVYPLPAPWAKIVYFPITYDLLRELVESSTVALGTGGTSASYRRHGDYGDVMQSFSELKKLSSP